MDNPKVEVHIQPNLMRRGVDLYILSTIHESTNLSLGTVTMAEMGPADYMPPSLSLSNLQAQALIDELWSAGFRPSDGAGSAGAMRIAEGQIAEQHKIIEALFSLLKGGHS